MDARSDCRLGRDDRAAGDGGDAGRGARGGADVKELVALRDRMDRFLRGGDSLADQNVPLDVRVRGWRNEINAVLNTNRTAKNLVLVSPTYGQVESQATRHLRAALFHATNTGYVQWVGDASPNRMQFAAARNIAVMQVLDSSDPAVQQADAIMWVDSDIVLPVDGITRLVAEDKDLITGVYCQREPPHFPLIAHFDQERRVFNWFIDMPPNVVAPID